MKVHDVYIVKGRTGLWEDSREWDVFAFISLVQAEEHKNKLNKIIEDFESHTPKNEDFSYELLEDLLKHLDPSMGSIDYNGVYYTVKKVELVD